jgi:type III secretion system FlhB-like substrate exporter
MNFATMNNESIIAKFAEEAKVDAKLAKRIVDKLSENELPVERMNSVIRRLKDFFVKNEY